MKSTLRLFHFPVTFYRNTAFKIAFLLAILGGFIPLNAQTDVDHIKRGMLAVRDGSQGIYVGWRLLGNDPENIGFNVYRITNGGAAIKLNDTPLTNATNFYDGTALVTSPNQYFVKPVIDDTEQESSDTASTWNTNFLNIPLQQPAGGTTPSPENISYSYEPNDASTADLDGDGEYEIILKWSPTNAKDNSQSGYTGNMILDAYELDGTLLWRIDFGVNVRSGAHYGPFMVYDFDGDGNAEVIARTAPGAKDGTGQFLSNGPAASDDDSRDYRNSGGYILTGPEYLTVFRGTDGAELATINLEPNRGNVTDWGDGYGNRVDRFLGAVAYLDGEKPSVVWCRGIYTKVELAAYSWDGKDLSMQWIFRSQSGYQDWESMGSHNLSVGDVDADGKDEIVYGNCAIDDDGTGLWSLKSQIGNATGDAMHLADMIPERPGLERWACGEGSGPGSHLVDAATGEVLFMTPNADVGRATAGDLTPDFYGMEVWGGTDQLRSSLNEYAGPWPSSTNHVVWWDGDLGRELLNSNTIEKYPQGRLLTANGCSANNGSKSNPCLQADIFGDWREEVIWRTNDNRNLRIYTTTDVTEYRIKTLMHDRQYRLAIAWQNNSYNQPPHASFYLGYDMFTPISEIPPAAPTGVEVSTRFQYFDLNWNSNKEYDIAGYDIYKAIGSGEFEKMNDAPVSSTGFKDEGILENVLYRYYIQAVDNDGNSSTPSAIVNGLALVKPAAPSNIYTSMGDRKNLIYWDPVVEILPQPLIFSLAEIQNTIQDDLSLKHAYTFADGSATDTVAGANGNVVGGSFNNGAYTASSNGQYIQLPAAEIAINTYAAITLEAYIVADVDNADPNMMAYFGGSVNGLGANGYFLTPDRWTESRTAISCGNTSQPWTAEQGVYGEPVSVGNKHHVVSILTNSSIKFYIDGNLVGENEVSGNNSISNLSNDFAWLCRGGYSGDPTWRGTIEEFNIYEGEMNETNVILRSVTWPNDDAKTGTGKIAGYNVYMSLGNNSGYQKLNTEPITDTAFIHENLINRTTYNYVVTSVDDGTNESYFPAEKSETPNFSIILQAENGILDNAMIESENEGFNGDGYVIFGENGTVTLKHVYSREDAWFRLNLRYALVGDEKSGEVIVNNTVYNFTMPSTGDWTQFQYLTVPVHLNDQFNNTIQIKANDADFAIIDEVLVGIKTTPNPVEDVLQNKISNLSVYPNPFNSVTHIQLHYTGNETPVVEIFNLFGQKIQTAPFEKVGVSTYQYQWDGNGISPGIYFIKSGNKQIKVQLK